MELLTFIIVSFGVIVIPGPNVLVIISTSLSHGTTRGLQAVAGTSLAMLIQLSIAALGTSLFVSNLAKGFMWLKWLGVTYLIYLGVKHLIALKSSNQPPISATGSFNRGFWVSLTNPKTILFFGAFLPQFTIGSHSYLSQIILLSVTFWLMALVLDSLYAILSAKLVKLLKAKNITKYQNGFCGALYLGAGVLLSTTKKAQ